MFVPPTLSKKIKGTKEIQVKVCLTWNKNSHPLPGNKKGGNCKFSLRPFYLYLVGFNDQEGIIKSGRGASGTPDFI